MKHNPETFELTEMELREAVSDYLYKKDIPSDKGFDIEFVITETTINHGSSMAGYSIVKTVSIKAKRRI